MRCSLAAKESLLEVALGTILVPDNSDLGDWAKFPFF